MCLLLCYLCLWCPNYELLSKVQNVGWNPLMWWYLEVRLPEIVRIR